ncbi:MAG: transcriptional regulator [Bdellovibrionales bacterium CG12_big_fil_rev_8_21_14_0_65_38_15]|nr:MAG: transcriptional regulator [Bdellovibrionales bacterium CG22_combo_CG10-13_8_21_14_all_38_13]PIQ54200.1 MAG: transcriptional regulator [Bdellovibrionales bacterium CG12_big_fil_rev_8_21_14_0_65_38_15]PIR29258.1 MAG: transcriptional regulator [Bdellovibrionales bacterium CG11_big_fil_rev_8_21_14_0_20_38_13]
MRLALAILVSIFLSAVNAQEPVLTLTQQRSLKIRTVFNDLRATNTEILDNFYAQDIVFEDPLGQINGLNSMKEYYKAMYKKVIDIRFEFKDDAINGDRHLCTWIMYMRVDGLNGGEEVVVHGVSEIEFNSESTLAIYHRDYFDMGEFVYQHIPVLGSIIKMVRKQLEHKPSGN